MINFKFMVNPLNLVKKTKAEIIEEYNKLLEQIDDVKTTSKFIHAQPSLDILNRARGININSIQEATAKLKNDLAENLNGFSNKFTAVLNDLIIKIEEELKKFEELQQAIEISKKILENQYHLQVAADSLELLIADYESKKKNLAEEYAKVKIEFENEINLKKLNQSREQEEYEYDRKLRQRRDQELFAEDDAKREKAWQERELMIKKEEEEIKKIKQEFANLPQTINKEVEVREKEIKARWENEFKINLNQRQKDWETKEQIYKIKVENLETQIKKQDLEILTLKKEQEQASKKTQEMAIKIIESGAGRAEEPEKTTTKII